MKNNLAVGRKETLEPMPSLQKNKFELNPALVFLLPYGILFTIFIVIPVLLAIILSFTNFDAVQFPDFTFLLNYINLFTQDPIFMQYVLPNTLTFTIVVGPSGYILSFFLAWSLSQISKVPRTILALIIYSPSMTSGVTMAVMWRIIFSGDHMGYINNLLLELGWITEPIQFLQSPEFLMPIMIIVALWGNMGVGFLAMLAGILNYDIGYMKLLQ